MHWKESLYNKQNTRSHREMRGGTVKFSCVGILSEQYDEEKASTVNHSSAGTASMLDAVYN